MIRVEIVLKSQWGNSIDGTGCERALKAEIVEVVTDRAKVDGLEIVRVQFLAAPPKPKKRAKASA